MGRPESTVDIGQSTAVSTETRSTTVLSGGLQVPPSFDDGGDADRHLDDKAIIPSARSLLPSVPMKRLDLNKLDRLYGRRDELAQLHEAYDRAQRRNKIDGSSTSTAVFLSGAAGTGKSALVAALQRRVEATGGFYARGKYEQFGLQEPYKALDEAFGQLFCRIMMLEEEDVEEIKCSSAKAKNAFSTISRIRNSIKTLVFSEGGEILLSFMPSLYQLIIGDDDDHRTNDNKFASREIDDSSHSSQSFVLGERAKHTCHFAFRRMVRLVCREMPFVLVLDDLQWADLSSLELLESLLTNNSDHYLENFLFIGCYRNQEEKHEVVGSRTIRHLETSMFPNQTRISLANNNEDEGQIDVVKIPIGNLSLGAVQELVADALDSSSSDDKTRDLTRIVLAKTAGNVFFVKEYLKSLVDDKLLEYQWLTCSWQWDLEQIAALTTVTGNVVDLMTNKMRQLTRDYQALLGVAACLGARFQASKLELIVRELNKNASFQKSSLSASTIGLSSATDEVAGTETAPSTTRRHLDFCVEEGLLDRGNVTGTSCGYCFVHDHIQRAAFSLVPESERDSLQYFGEVLMLNLSRTELDEYLFVTADLVNCGVAASIVDSPRRKLEIAKLNK